MDTFGLIVLVVTLLVSFGVLIGFTISELLIGARTRRQAAVQRSLNEQWQEIDAQWKEIEAAGNRLRNEQTSGASRLGADSGGGTC